MMIIIIINMGYLSPLPIRFSFEFQPWNFSHVNDFNSVADVNIKIYIFKAK